MFKFDGEGVGPLTVSEVKQIAGRAGRYRSAKFLTDSSAEVDTADGVEESNSSVGLATTLERSHLPLLKAAMAAYAKPVMTAGISPPISVVERFAGYFAPAVPLSYILVRLHEVVQMNKRFHLCLLREQLLVADAIHSIRNLTVSQRLIFCAAPVSQLSSRLELLKHFAMCVAQQKACRILEIDGLALDILDREATDSRLYLKELEGLHKDLIVYLWLSFRFHGIFLDRNLAMHTKGLVETAISRCLDSVTIKRRVVKPTASHAELLQMLQQNMFEGAGTESPPRASRVGKALNLAAGQDLNLPDTLDTAKNTQLVGDDEDLPDGSDGDFPEEALAISEIGTGLDSSSAGRDVDVGHVSTAVEQPRAAALGGN